MDREKRERRRSIKLIVSETIMVLAVVLTVIVLALIVSGYWVNSDFKVERQGLLQVSSMPTGADVYIDGESSWLQRTNTSKVLSSGEHTVSLSKEGYDSWSKTINIEEGLLYRLHYPRLFLKNRSKEKTYTMTAATYVTVSPNREVMLAANATTSWQLVALDNEKIEPKKINVANYFSGVSLAAGAETGVFNSQIIETKWAHDNTHLLFKVKHAEKTEWVLLDVKNIANSVNITKKFGANFEQIEILDDSASNLLAIENGNLHKIDVSSKQISAILASNIISFDHYKNEIIFTAKDATATTPKYYIGFIEGSDEKVNRIGSVAASSHVVISRFYDDKYIAVLSDSSVFLYQKEDFVQIRNYALTFSPQKIKVGHNGEFITMYTGPHIATLDMESLDIIEWSVNAEKFDWLDTDMIYAVENGSLAVYDYDGLNRRVLAQNVSSTFPVTITDDKWLYYFSDNSLMREWLIAR